MHTLEKKSPLLTLDAGSATNKPNVEGEAQNASIIASTPVFDPLQPGGIVMKASEMAADSVVNFFTNPFLIVLGAIVLIYKYNEVRRWIARKRKAGLFAFRSYEEDLSAERTEPVGIAEPGLSPVESVDKPTAIISDAKQEAAADDMVGPGPAPASNRDAPHSVTFAEPLPELQERNGSVSADGLEGTLGAEQGEKKEKKAHRGKRGGAKHKKNKGNKTQNQQSSDSGSPVPDEIAEAVDKAKNMVENPVIEPDIQTITSDPETVSGPVLKMGSFEVNTDQQLGTGSNGTVVFAGTFDGRPVAVKRMLIQFNEIATQETRLLRESDDHPNGK
jgi:serine/threonine-protein kinase/endoribonuclease IRE1